MNSEVKNIMLKLESLGYKAYIVGGYVRDYLLNINSNDYDICTDANTDELLSILKDYNPKVELGTLSININNVNIEITTFRIEVDYVKRKPIYIYTDKLELDLLRRDFTVNTLCMDSSGNVIDLLGASKDLNNHIIKLIGNKDERLISDPLRILRAIRFSISLDFDIESETKEAIINNKNHLLNISYEVKKKELDKIIQIKGLDKIKEYELDSVLEIDLSNYEYYDDLFLMWYQIDKNNKYLYKNKEKKLVNILNDLEKRDITLYDVYMYEEEIINYVSILRNLNINYDDLVIKERKDIKITSSDILNIVKDNKLIESVYKDLEYKIINGELENNHDKIVSYLNTL